MSKIESGCYLGLFQKIALLSGTALSPGVVRDTAINATWILDRKLHCRSFNSSELLECFKKQLKDEILDISASAYISLQLMDLILFSSSYLPLFFMNSHKFSFYWNCRGYSTMITKNLCQLLMALVVFCQNHQKCLQHIGEKCRWWLVPPRMKVHWKSVRFLQPLVIVIT